MLLEWSIFAVIILDSQSHDHMIFAAISNTGQINSLCVAPLHSDLYSAAYIEAVLHVCVWLFFVH